MSDEDAAAAAEEKPKRVRNRPSRSTNVSRFERRAGKIAETLKQATKWQLGTSSDDDLDFTHTVERDAGKIGHALAAVGEWFDPVGKLFDIVFGLTGPLAVFVGLSPTLQAARRSALEQLEKRRERKQQQAQQLEEQRLAEQFDQGDTWPPLLEQEQPADVST